ncbi:hypothetical protein CONPUDRAFT_124008 [Coniophora puteana RWD-64-598 SS2]|uniref:NOT2/NOT3/NOT5 C-terminal domain-containing protein n=1 Tax=Coniophora puteana (strain RWD-64-598) TaxID=741705 RepID=A0A5M3MPI3_CONPW|nr:uncharacterized protein CONPUDRAFT_124008 [Coniophora puteana RWD-64-598 SS2]EIW81078.1 hypothetical protein CONPUDRAFT_124008 [Coniophora puteana RWD-64-598 SS2]
MNRPGQPQRAGSLAPPGSLASQFRSPYPTSQFSMPQRSYPSPGIQPQNTHRASAQPQSPFMPTRTQGQAGGYPFNQVAGPPGQNGPPPSASATSDVGFDPSDFPALGSLSASNQPNASNQNNSGGNGATPGAGATPTSYASQAGQSGSAVPPGGQQGRDFGPEDFPALGGSQPTQQLGGGVQGQGQPPNPAQASESQNMLHPPGLNGFNDQHRTSLLGSLNIGTQQVVGGVSPSTQQPGTPGMLNLRGIHPGFSSQEIEKPRSNGALTPGAGHTPNPVSGQPQSVQAQTTPVSAQPPQGQNPGQIQQQMQSQQQPQQHLNAPPGVSLPGSGTYVPNGGQHPIQQQQQQQALPSIHPQQQQQEVPPHAQNVHTPGQIQQHPETPAQQVLMSAADRWGLLGLIAMIKNAAIDADGGLSSVGTDLGAVGLDMGYEGNLYSTFITPWADQSAAHTVEPDFHLPSCYNVQPPPPGPSKAAAFSDETLFFMFYSSPRDALQEVAAQELWNRNWRYHKDLRIWITKESGSAPSSKIPGGEAGTYTWWDPESWCKERKEMNVRYADLEEKTVPAFAMGPGLVPAQGGQGHLPNAGQQQQQQQGLGAQQRLQQMAVAGGI